MSVILSEIRPGAYFDSVILMQMQKSLLELPGVLDVGVVMGTEANKSILEQSGLLSSETKIAKSDDLIIAIKAQDREIGKRAISQVENLSKRASSTVANEYVANSLKTAARMRPDAKFVLVSVPGIYAAEIVHEALELGKHVILYSDNVSIEEEIDLKQRASQKGLMMMGADCGTVMINGVGLGFANRVRPGKIGLIGASGTGLQSIMTHIHNLGGGVSHAIGTGGRDLQMDVGAITTIQGLNLLSRDPGTKVIVMVSKPPSPEVTSRLLSSIRRIGKPAVLYFIGYAAPGRQFAGTRFAGSLRDAALSAIKLVDEEYETQIPETIDGNLRGIFSGGTLAYEATLRLQATLNPLYSNVPVQSAEPIPENFSGVGHTIVDLGSDEFTVGRLHPMIDNDLRVRYIKKEALDPNVGVLLLDVVLGYGAHPDPASELAPAIEYTIRNSVGNLEVVAIVLGTEDDPQDVEHQIVKLNGAGAIVFRSTSEATDYISVRMASQAQVLGKQVSLESLQPPTSIINVGLESFYNSLIDQGAKAIQTNWRPPAGGDQKLMAILKRMKTN